MTNLLRWAVVAILVLHGFVHLLAAVQRFGWVDDPVLARDPALGVLWLAAAILLLAAALLAALGAPTWWWLLAIVAAVTSEAAIMTSWSVSGSGTLVNVLLILIAIYSLLLRGPPSFRGQWRRRSKEALEAVDPDPTPLTEDELAGLPEPLAAYIRRSLRQGEPREASLHARFHGRIRSDADAEWMPFRGRQVNTFGDNPTRTFLMIASRSGVPITVLHCFADGRATMRGKVLSLLTVVDASGPEMDRSETVTVFNDLVVLAPGAIVDAPITWTCVGKRQVRGVFTLGSQSVSAVLTFDERDDLIDFVSDDRSRASADGRSFTPQTWSTPLRTHRDVDGLRLLTTGAARWLGPDGWFTYIELEYDEITYNVHEVETGPASGPALQGLTPERVSRPRGEMTHRRPRRAR
ncbi:DUF6544 family protein [Aeromicrobium duanguangcaii]|uniref:DUF6544 family protein n=1 Tax=Aeromicrobium duanguangcaii TaxID=2968086 RepID=UPI002016D998|nr:DUF6544 family protein [Aeromicrobium duanguangcaii]MCL3836498.1 hypothetical protein [Aeromicrobium duanguangcaii]